MASTPTVESVERPWKLDCTALHVRCTAWPCTKPESRGLKCQVSHCYHEPCVTETAWTFGADLVTLLLTESVLGKGKKRESDK